MKLYIASRMSNGPLVKALSVKIQSMNFGFEFTQRWPDERWSPTDRHTRTQRESIDIAARDLDDIERAEGVILFTLNCDEIVAPGMHFEAGYAAAQGKTIYVVGPRVSVFYYLPAIYHFETIDAFLADIQHCCG